MEKKEEYVVCEEKYFYLIFIIVCAILTYISYWAFTLDANDSVFEYRNVGYIRIISFLGIIAFSLLTLFYIKSYISLKKNNRILVLTEKGIECNNPGMEYIGWIGWEEITDIAVEKDGDYTVLNVYFFNKNRELEKTREKRVRTIFKEKDGMQLASIPLLETNRDKDEIKEKVQEYWAKYGQGGEQIGSLEKKAVEKQERLVEENVQNKIDLIGGVLEAADSKNYHKLQESIEIKRNGKILFDFNIRSLSREEIRRLDEKYIAEEYSLQKIYLATIDKEEIWDNKEIQSGLEARGFSISTVIDVIQAVLEESEIKEINARIDKISGFHDSEISNVN